MKKELRQAWLNVLNIEPKETVRLTAIQANDIAIEYERLLCLTNVVGQSEQFTPKQLYMLAQKHSIQDFQKILKEAPTWKG